MEQRDNVGILSNLFEPKTESVERREWYTALLSLGGMPTKAGVRVSEDGALVSTAVWACVRVLSESVASLPLILYRRTPDGGKERATDHPLYSIMHDAPNPQMTSYEFRQTALMHICTWGNFYAEMQMTPSGDVRALWPLLPGKMEKVGRDALGNPEYHYRLPDNSIRVMTAAQVFHVRAMGGSGLKGWSPVRMHMEAIGLGLATQEFGARFFGSGANLGGILEHPGKLSPEAQSRLRQSFVTENAGLKNAHRIKILEEGMKFTSVGIPPEEAQFLETRKFQVNEIARIYRVPPHMIGDLEHATFSNIEHQSLEFVMHTLRPHLVRDEQAYARQLLTRQDRRVLFFEHLVDGLLRGDITSRYEAYNTAIQAGWMNRNEVRVRENLNPVEGLDEYLVPLNMASIAQFQAMPPPEQNAAAEFETRAASDRAALAGTQQALIEDVADRIVRREINDIGRAITKYLVRGDDAEAFLLWLSAFYEEHQGFIARQSKPTFEVMSQLVLQQVASELESDDLVTQAGQVLRTFAADYVATMALRWAIGNRGQLEYIMREETPGADQTIADLLQARLDGWAETEAAKVAMRESVRAVNAMAKAGYRAAGVTRLRWVARGSDTCPYCKALNGKIVGIEENFVEAGDFDPDGAEQPLKVRRSVGHPPVHQGCDCQIVAA